MTSDSQEASFAAAVARLDKAMEKLDGSVRGLSVRMRTVAQLETENQRLASDRAQLAAELDRTRTRADALDKASAEVSQQIVEAMDSVRSVIEAPN